MKRHFDFIIPMDGDGEDRPEEINEFLNKVNESNGRAIIGQRVKRSEGLIFKICYQIHKLITLTSQVNQSNLKFHLLTKNGCRND